MTLDVLRPTFRDPAGSLSLQGDQAVRLVHPTARDSVLEFLASPLRRHLEEGGDMVATIVQDTPDGLRLLHPRIDIPTYPWEWTASQWLAAARLTLRLCEEALDEGWILKDATPLNILFVGTRPVLVDVLSFERRTPGSSIWLAYGQYVRTFLLPLVVNRMLGWPLALTMLRRDGYEPAELYALMNWPQRLYRAAFWPITLPTLLERRRGEKPPGVVQPVASSSDDEAAVHILKRTLADLGRRTERAVVADPASEWSQYQSTLKHYSSAASERKRTWMREILREAQPQRVLDIGANTGEYTLLAAEQGIEVVALERDAAAAERLFRLTRSSAKPVLTILADLARPTPAVGWENSESSGLLTRLVGKFDLVMMLAVIHHLLLLEQIPLRAIVELCHSLTTAFFVVEWVPVQDPMFQSLLRGREALYAGLTEADLLTACERLFTVGRREELENGRVLLLLQKQRPVSSS